MLGTTKILAVLCCMLVVSSGATVVAGPLDDHPLAYDDNAGPGTGGRWAGTAAYSSGALMGMIDFAVFTEAGYNLAFPLSSYTPTAGQLVYAFQVRNAGGSPAVTIEGVSADPANNIGSFLLTVGDIAPSGDDLSGGAASWEFLAPAINGGENSYGLVFSSQNRPQLTGTSLTINGGLFATTIVPEPGDVPIPEPASLLMLGIAGIWIALLRRRAGV